MNEIEQAVSLFKERLELKDEYDNNVPDYFKALELGVKVFEKRLPKKPIIVTNMMTKEKGACCPSCRNFLSKTVAPYCCYCGQHLKWSD